MRPRNAKQHSILYSSSKVKQWFGKRCILTILCLLSGLSQAAERPNVLLICIDDLRPELKCFGVDYIQSPNIDELAAQGRAFHRHYVQAPTCGASRCALLTGCYGGAGNEALFQRAEQLKAGKDIPPSMPAWFRSNGYTTVSVGKVSHHPGGRGGADWDDDSNPEMPDSWDRHLLKAGAWQHPRGHMHGLANGEIRVDSIPMDVFQSSDGEDNIYPDGMTTETALEQLDVLTGDATKPFFLAVGIIRPHLPFGAPAKYMTHYENARLPEIAHPEKPQGKTTWHNSGEFMKYNRWQQDPNKDREFALAVRRHYAACVTYADAQVGRVIDRLKDRGAWGNTIVVLWGDHGWHLGEHAIWGKHSLFEESLRSPLIIRHQDIQRPGLASQSMVETIDLFPTLCELTNLPHPDFAQGVSLVPILKDPQAPGHPAVSYFKNDRTLRTEAFRLVAHGDGHLELYDLASDPGETQNVAEHSHAQVQRLLVELNSRRP